MSGMRENGNATAKSPAAAPYSSKRSSKSDAMYLKNNMSESAQNLRAQNTVNNQRIVDRSLVGD